MIKALKDLVEKVRRVKRKFQQIYENWSRTDIWKAQGKGIGEEILVGLALPLGPGSAVLPAASWPVPPSLARCPASGPVEGAVLALPIGSGRAGRSCERRAPAGCPRPPSPEAHTRLCTSSFPRHLSRVLGRVIVRRSAPWQNCLQ